MQYPNRYVNIFFVQVGYETAYGFSGFSVKNWGKGKFFSDDIMLLVRSPIFANILLSLCTEKCSGAVKCLQILAIWLCVVSLEKILTFTNAQTFAAGKQ